MSTDWSQSVTCFLYCRRIEKGKVVDRAVEVTDTTNLVSLFPLLVPVLFDAKYAVNPVQATQR